MGYFSGTTSTTSAPSKDFIELVLHPNLITSGFTYVEEYVGASYTDRIYKSSSASNGVGDWYLILERDNNTTGTTIRYGVCEDYDIATHFVKKWAPYNVSGSQTLPADRSHYTTAGIKVDTGSCTDVINTIGTPFPWIASLHPKRVVISTRPSSASTMYAGLYDPISSAVANHFPLVSSGSQSNWSAGTCYTREPGTGTSVTTGSGRGTFTDQILFYNWAPASNISSIDGYHLKPTISRSMLPASQSKQGYRGYGIGVYSCPTTGFVWGDIVNIDWAGTPVTATCVYSNAKLVDQAM
jgi:hypothetical protein